MKLAVHKDSKVTEADFPKSCKGPKMPPKWSFGKNLVHRCVLFTVKSEKPSVPLPFCKNHMPGKNLVLERAKRAKVGGAVRRIGSKIKRFTA